MTAEESNCDAVPEKLTLAVAICGHIRRRTPPLERRRFAA
jgi:hypothetical protein